LSAIVLGILIFFEAKPPLWIAIIIVAFFAIFHGYAHGAELPASAQPLAYAVGFVVMTGMLHVCGIIIGTIHKWKSGQLIVRILGGLVSLTGVYFLVNAF